MLHPQGPNILLQIVEKGLGGSCPSHDQGGKITVVVMVVAGWGRGWGGGPEGNDKGDNYGAAPGDDVMKMVRVRRVVIIVTVDDGDGEGEDEGGGDDGEDGDHVDEWAI